ncbi:unnamed protein product [Orchesella dallaii]|uniref:Beta-lactamase-related domain-containing protein n=1 Tax=Orchesella dallaii TaxID=48710 RepID=A0ABP1RIW8_9HEXA
MGELVLDTPIIKLLPDSNFTLVDRFRTEHVTFRDLLAHRLCVIRDDLQLQAEPFDTVEEIVFRIRYAEDVCGLRTSQVYNNQMFIALSLLVRQITGRSYEDMGYELLNEIGMFNSAFIAKADDFPNMFHRAQPYYVVDNVAYPTNPELIKRVAPTTIAAGGLFTTPNDMARYLRLHLNLGKIDGKQIIPEEVMLWTREPSIHFPYSDFKITDNDITTNTLSYGLALRLGIYDGWEHINHGGYFPPYKSLISMFPALKLGIFTSSNQAPSLVDQTVLHSFIFETLRGNENARKVAETVHKKEQRRHLEEMNSKKKQLGAFLRASEKEGFHPSPNEIVGRYGNGLSGELEIFFKFNPNINGTGLYLSYGKWLKGWMERTDNYGVYNLIWDTDIVHDDYAWGLSDGRSMYASVKAGKIDLITITPYGELFRGQFEKEFRFDKLPIIPWNSENCSN